MAVGQNQWFHFGIGAPPILEPILVGIESDVHWGYGILTHGPTPKCLGSVFFFWPAWRPEGVHLADRRENEKWNDPEKSHPRFGFLSSGGTRGLGHSLVVASSRTSKFSFAASSHRFISRVAASLAERSHAGSGSGVSAGQGAAESESLGLGKTWHNESTLVHSLVAQRKSTRVHVFGVHLFWQPGCFHLFWFPTVNNHGHKRLYHHFFLGLSAASELQAQLWTGGLRKKSRSRMRLSQLRISIESCSSCLERRVNPILCLVNFHSSFFGGKPMNPETLLSPSNLSATIRLLG